MDTQKLTEEIAALERKAQSTTNQKLKEALQKKIERLKNDLTGQGVTTSQLATKLLRAKKKIKNLSKDEFQELIRRLSKKPEYSFLSSMTKQEIEDDISRKAKPVGWRFKGKDDYRTPGPKQLAKGKKDGTVYWENRANRSDVSQVAQLKDGGEVERIRVFETKKMKPYDSEDFLITDIKERSKDIKVKDSYGEIYLVNKVILNNGKSGYVWSKNQKFDDYKTGGGVGEYKIKKQSENSVIVELPFNAYKSKFDLDDRLRIQQKVNKDLNVNYNWLGYSVENDKTFVVLGKGKYAKGGSTENMKKIKINGLDGYMPGVNFVYYDDNKNFFYKDFEGDLMEVKNQDTMNKLNSYLNMNKMEKGGNTKNVEQEVGEFIVGISDGFNNRKHIYFHQGKLGEYKGNLNESLPYNFTMTYSLDKSLVYKVFNDLIDKIKKEKPNDIIELKFLLNRNNLYEKGGNVRDNYEEIINFIKYEVDYVPDSIEEIKKYPEPYKTSALKALEYRKNNFKEMSESKKRTYMEEGGGISTKKMDLTKLKEWKKQALKDSKIKLEKLGFNKNHKMFEQNKATIDMIFDYVQKLINKGVYDEFGVRYSYEVTKYETTGTVIASRNKLSDKFKQDWISYKKEFPYADVDRFYVTKFSEIINPIWGTNFGENSFTYDGYGVGFNVWKYMQMAKGGNIDEKLSQIEDIGSLMYLGNKYPEFTKVISGKEFGDVSLEITNGEIAESNKEFMKELESLAKHYTENAEYEIPDVSPSGERMATGGTVIGKTKSGKNVYSGKRANIEKNFTAQDHEDAAYLNLDKAMSLTQKGYSEMADFYNEEFDRHLNTARYKKATVEEDSMMATGGIIIGKTKTGKNVYAGKKANIEKDFSVQDHKDAAYLNLDRATLLTQKGFPQMADFYNQEFDRHLNTARYKEATMKEGGNVNSFGIVSNITLKWDDTEVVKSDIMKFLEAAKDSGGNELYEEIIKSINEGIEKTKK